jgi:hypothetical protein
VKTTTVQLPDPLAQKAVAKAKRMGISQSKVLREAIEKGLSDERSEPSMAAMMSDVLGCIDGAADASVNYKEIHRQAIAKKYGKNAR